MKNQKGITLTSLIIYIIVIIIGILLLARISVYFTSNMSKISEDTVGVSELDKFNMYFIKDVKEKENGIKGISSSSIDFTNGSRYYFDSEEEVIYFKNANKEIAISETVNECRFSVTEENGKTVVKVNISISNEETENEFVMDYDNIYYN